MKLILSKKQEKKGLVASKIVYALTIKADLTEEEKSNLAKYGMENEVIYSDAEGNPTESAWKAIKTIATSTVLRVSDLSLGKTIECSNFIEIVQAEEKVKQACTVLKNLLEAMENFEGEQVIDIE